MIRFLFLDLDDTILDFHKAERIAITKTFRELGVEPTEALMTRYSQINLLHWQMLERGELTREQVLVRRFAALYEEQGIDADPALTAKSYEHNLGIGHYFLPGAEEAVEALSKKYRLFLASNGTACVQHSRMASADLDRFFEDQFISQEVGFNKPTREYFEASFARIPGFRREEAMMVGDSLTSDILGGINAGLRTCWVNVRHQPPREDIRPDYEIDSLSRLESLLETIQ